MSKTIHFICRGNTYRSRLAEAYFNSLKLPGLKAISSGIQSGIYSGIHTDGPIEWYSMRIIHDSFLIEYMSRDGKRTTKEMLAKGDFTIFIDPSIYEFCKEKLGYDSNLHQVWNVQDMRPKDKSVEDIVKISEKTFELIKSNVDALVKTLITA